MFDRRWAEVWVCLDRSRLLSITRPHVAKGIFRDDRRSFPEFAAISGIFRIQENARGGFKTRP
jgi:hypothetical protein